MAMNHLPSSRGPNRPQCIIAYYRVVTPHFQTRIIFTIFSIHSATHVQIVHVSLRSPPQHHQPCGKLTWQWKNEPRMKMYSLLNMGILHCYVCLPECFTPPKPPRLRPQSRVPNFWPSPTNASQLSSRPCSASRRP